MFLSGKLPPQKIAFFGRLSDDVALALTDPNSHLLQRHIAAVGQDTRTATSISRAMLERTFGTPRSPSLLIILLAELGSESA